MDDRAEQFQEGLQTYQLMEAAGIASHPVAIDYLARSLSPLDGGAHAAAAKARLEGMVTTRLVAAQVLRDSMPTWPAVAPEAGILLGLGLATGLLVWLALEVLNRHMLIVGASGSGKTVFIFALIQELIRHGMRVLFSDYKGEGRRIPGAMVFRPDQEPTNLLDPVGDEESYRQGWSAEFGRAWGLHAETWTELPELLGRIHKGRKPGDWAASPRDVESVLRVLEEREPRPKWRTLRRAFTNLNSLLGPRASIRKGVEIFGRYPVCVHERQGLPPRPLGFLAAVGLLRQQAQATTTGRTDFRNIYVCDEASLEHDRSLGETPGYTPPFVRAIRQVRSAGQGIIAAAQEFCELDESTKSNFATLACFRCKGLANGREALRLLELPEDRLGELMNLPVGVAYVRSEGFTRAVKIRVKDPQWEHRPTNEEVARLMAPELARLDREIVRGPDRPAAESALDYVELLGERATVAESAREADPDGAGEELPLLLEEQLELLREVDAHPGLGVSQHYRNLGWSAGRGQRVRDELVEQGVLVCERSNSANGRPKEVLSLTEKGRRLLHE